MVAIIIPILLGVWFVYALFIIYVVHKQLTKGIKYITHQNSEDAKKYDPFARKDVQKWNHYTMYLVAITVFPLRCIHVILSLILCSCFCNLLTLGVSDMNNISARRTVLIKANLRFFSRQALLAFGFYWIKRTTVNIADIDSSYPSEQSSKLKGRVAPLVVSNHISFVDGFVHLSSKECPSFVAKADLAKLPGFGSAFKAHQVIFVDRDSKNQRSNVMEKIKERIEKWQNNPKAVPSTLIFPEGTTSNGEYVLSFKKGAFANLTPVKICGLKYNYKRFNPAYDSIDLGQSLLFMMLQVYNSVEQFDAGIYYPDHLNIKSENEWEIYAQKVKTIIMGATRTKTSDMGYSDGMAYFTSLKAACN